MEIYKIENLTFSYANSEKPVLNNINLSISQGEFITLCGKSGCGKTTLLRLLKPILSPNGETDGNILFNNKPLRDVPEKTQASQIGFVMQSPDSCIVTDKVWHELAFGLECLGIPTSEMRTRTAEMASFFGIQEWFHKKTTDLSGGQKQILNLASVMVMQPSVLILDEPTSQLDPIAAQEFLKTLEKINREFGTTVILAEHRLENAFPISDRVIVMHEGRIIADDKPDKIGKLIKNHPIYPALPTPMRVYSAIENGDECPITVREGRIWLENYAQCHQINSVPKGDISESPKDVAVELEDIWFRYEKNAPDTIKGLSAKIHKGELFSIIGGNGAGKTTVLSLIGGLYTPYRGKILINGKNLSQTDNLYNGVIGMLPQNPQNLFIKKTVYLDLMDILSDEDMTESEKESFVRSTATLCDIEPVLSRHPYDLSGGEQQRAALAKILLKQPEILLLDEPTKGMDAHFKQIFASIINTLKAKGTTIIIVSHDIEFCAEYSDACALIFDGIITSTGKPREFFTGNSFYTTAANRMARTVIPDAVLAEDIILACGGETENKYSDINSDVLISKPETKNITQKKTGTKSTASKKTETKKAPPIKAILGCVFAVLFIITCVMQMNMDKTADTSIIQLISIVELIICASCFIHNKKFDTNTVNKPQKSKKRFFNRHTAAVLISVILIPITILIGVFRLEDKNYYLISFLVILETLIPFLAVFEQRKPSAKELVVISVICAVAVLGRAVFFTLPLPQFKPILAIVIIAGVCLGGEAGMLIGAVSGFVSNFFFGQGPWTPWQMLALGASGFLAGIFFGSGLLKKTKLSLCIFGAASTFLVYGLITNSSMVFMYSAELSAESFIESYILGAQFDLIHAASTVFFLWTISEPMIEKIERVKIKYGLIRR